MPSPAKKRYPMMYQPVEYSTDSQENPPTSAGRMRIIDRGCVSPRLCRASLRAVPQSKDLLSQSGLMMGAILNPLADLDQTDIPNQVPLIDYTANEIVRCNRCRAYVNPHVKFINMGKDFVCNFCGFTNEVPRWYMYNLDGYGKRRDLEQRPELMFGAVDYIATKEYVTKEAKPLTYVFVLDVGANSLNQGIFQTVISTLKQAITNIVTRGSDLSVCRVTLITFGRTIHFYNMKGQHPQIMVVGDVSQDGAGFVPFPESSLLTFQDLVEGDFLDRIVSLATTMQESDNVMGSAIVAAQALVAETGGRIILFSSQLPTQGQGRMKPREDFKVYGTDKEKSLFNGQLGFWRFFGQECARRAICIDMYLFGSGFMETSTLTIATQLTNGHTYLYYHFDAAKDQVRLLNDLQRHLSRETGYEGLMKVRCSSGLSLRRYFGNFSSTTEEDMDLAGIDADTSFGVELKHDAKLDENLQDHYMQAVLLYTSRAGIRKLRIMTLKLGIATTMSNLFKKADMDATLGLTSRLLVNQVVKNRDSLETVRSMINTMAIDILAAYRKHCSQTSSPGQLILPEALKLLPIYYLGLAKTPCFRIGTDVMLDERINGFNILMEMSTRSLLTYCYPYLFSIHNMPDSEIVEAIDADTREEIMYPLPPLMSLTSARIETNGLYLLNDGYGTWWWIGAQCPNEVISDVFGVPSFNDIGSTTVPNPNLESVTGKRVQAILEELSKQAVRNGPVRIYKERDQGETQFFARLVEDRYGSGAMNYVEYLCWLHKEIQGRLNY
jgi:protein transport protein SEC24